MKGIYIDGRLTSREEAVDKLDERCSRFSEATHYTWKYLQMSTMELRDTKPLVYVHEASHHLHELRKVLNDVIGIVDEFSVQAEAEDTKEVGRG